MVRTAVNKRTGCDGAFHNVLTSTVNLFCTIIAEIDTCWIDTTTFAFLALFAYLFYHPFTSSMILNMGHLSRVMYARGKLAPVGEAD